MPWPKTRSSCTAASPRPRASAIEASSGCSGAGASPVRGWLGNGPRYLIIYLVIILAMAWLYVRLPSSFLPEEDQGYFITAITLPVGATQERTIEVLKQV